MNGIILKEFQFGDFISLMWCSYLGQLPNKMLQRLHLGKIFELVKEISFEAD